MASGNTAFNEMATTGRPGIRKLDGARRLHVTFSRKNSIKRDEIIPPSGVTSSSRPRRSAMHRREVNVLSKIYAPMGEEQEWPREL